MKSSFKGFSADGLRFLSQLARNNDREWFAPRKQIYEEQMRLPMLALVGDIHREMLRFAPRYVGEPAKCVFRIYRDTGFSKDKTPYRDHIAASFWRNDLGKGKGAGFYFSVSPKEIEVAGGIYQPESDALLAIRQRIAEDPDAFHASRRSKKLHALMGELQGDSAARVPKGFAATHPAIDHIRRKRYLFDTYLDPAMATSPKLFGEVVRRFEAMSPFLAFLNQAVTKKV